MTEEKQITIEVVLMERRAIIDQITASMAHGIKNPLTVIDSGASLLRNDLKDLSSDDTEDILGGILDCSKRIDKMVKSLSVFTGKGMGISDIGGCIDHTLNLFYFSEVIPIEKEYSKGLSGLKIDYPEINQALFDVFRCIEDYRSKKSGGSYRIIKKVDGQDEQMKMKIKTEKREGGAISITITYPEQIPVASTMPDIGHLQGKRKEKRGGLGLLIAQYIMQKNSGDLYLESGEEETTFRLEFREKEGK